jgi:uncharacterized membrane protein
LSSAKNIQWLYAELPQLVRDGVLTQAQADALRARYGDAQPASRASIITILFSVLAASFIAGGVILVLASNWDELGRGARAVLSALPLLAGQLAVAFTLWKRNDSVAWREGSGILLAGGIGASIALIGQTYHIPGDSQSFLFVWILLGLPLVYLLGATTVALAGMAATVTWAMGQRDYYGETAYFYWVFLAALLPHVWQAWRADKAGPRFQVLGWGLCGMLAIMPVGLPEDMLDGWIPLYSALASAGVLFGASSWAGRRLNPFVICGGAATAALGLMLSMQGFWESGWSEWDLEQKGYFTRGTLALALPFAMFMVLWAGNSVLVKLWALQCLLIFAAYFGTGAGVDPGLFALLFNAYIFALGVMTLIEGARSGRPGLANVGMALVSLLAILRFFDSDLGILLRGVIFILVGAGFLLVNLYIAQRGRKAAA